MPHITTKHRMKALHYLYLSIESAITNDLQEHLCDYGLNHDEINAWIGIKDRIEEHGYCTNQQLNYAMILIGRYLNNCELANP